MQLINNRKMKGDKMKKELLIFIALFFIHTYFLFATEKDTEEIKTIFDLKELKIGGYIGPEIKHTKILDNNGLLIGGSLGFILNHHFSLGFMGYGIVTEHKLKNYTPNDRLIEVNGDILLRGGYGGMEMEYIIFPNYPIHFVLHSGIGIGGLVYDADKWRYKDENYYRNDSEYGNDDDILESSVMFVYEPSIKIEFNVLKMLRCGFSGGYRFVSGVDLPNTTNEDLSDFSFGFYMKAGIF